jgi:hypothetical protein
LFIYSFVKSHQNKEKWSYKFPLNETKNIDTPHKVDVRKIFDKETAQAMHITLLPSEALKPQITPVDVS